jgi:CRP-like cAMP-binding protein
MSAGLKIGEEFVKKFGKKFPAEAFLMREGDPGSTLLIIQSGKVAILKNTPAGEKVLATLGEGNFFGEMALMGLQDRRAASAKTLVETVVLELNRDAFEAIIRRSPELAFNVIRVLTERVRDSNGKLAALVHKDDRIRLSTYLTFLATERGVPAPDQQPGRCFVCRPREIGGVLGVATEGVVHFVNLAKKARILGQNGEWIWAPYPQYLQPFAEYLVAKG